MHQGHRPQRVVDAGAPVREGVLHREHEAGRQLAEGTAGIHQGRRVRHPHARRHQLEEGLGEALHSPIGGTIRPIGSGDGARDAPEQVLRPLHRLPLVVLHKVAALEHSESVGAQVETLHAQLTAYRVKKGS